MPDPVALLHPRKLYAMLRACPTAETRARAALEFLRGGAGSNQGFLYLVSAGGLVVASASRDSTPPSGLAEEVARAWERQTAMQEDNTRTLDVAEIRALRLANESPIWMSPNGERFERRCLSMHREGRRIALGMVVLRAEEGRELLPVRHAHIEALCSALLDSGDVRELASPPA